MEKIEYKLLHAQKTIKKLKERLKMHQQTNRRYKKRIISLSLLTNHLQDRRLLSQDAAECIEVRIYKY